MLRLSIRPELLIVQDIGFRPCHFVRVDALHPFIIEQIPPPVPGVATVRCIMATCHTRG